MDRVGLIAARFWLAEVNDVELEDHVQLLRFCGYITEDVFDIGR